MTDPETQTETVNPNRLNLNDLFKLVQWMNLGFERGSYKADEIGEVTGVYSRVYGFCKIVETQQQEAEKKAKEEDEKAKEEDEKPSDEKAKEEDEKPSEE